MATAPLHPCAHPRCPRLIARGRQCPKHPRPTAQQSGYTSKWATYAKAWRARFPWCGQRQDGQFHAQHSACVRRGLRVRAQVVDHIRSLVAGGRVFDPANHQSLCVSCNTRKR